MPEWPFLIARIQEDPGGRRWGGKRTRGAFQEAPPRITKQSPPTSRRPPISLVARRFYVLLCILPSLQAVTYGTASEHDVYLEWMPAVTGRASVASLVILLLLLTLDFLAHIEPPPPPPSLSRVRPLAHYARAEGVIHRTAITIIIIGGGPQPPSSAIGGAAGLGIVHAEEISVQNKREPWKSHFHFGVACMPA